MAPASSDSVHRPRLFIIALVMVAWISCSLVTQIANKKVLSAELSPMLLIGCQMVFGCALQVIISVVICLKDSTDRKCFELNPLCFAVGAFNVMVHMLTYYSMTMISPGLTQILRGTEPIWMMVCSYLLLQITTSIQQIISASVMILGVCSIVLGGNDEVGTDQAMFIKGVAIVLVANVAIAVKKCASKKYTEVSGYKLTYPEVCSYSLLIVVGPFLFNLPSHHQSDTLSYIIY